jgi:pterin-4a-carbinolamine dehydratase
VTFNAACQVELQEMNQNVIYNIINRGGINGWTTAENLDDLKRSFTFSSFEQA